MDYCRYSAMPVGRHVLDLHNEDPRRTHPASDALCASLQVLNHLQDCAADLAGLDRCYLPQDLLARSGAGTQDLRSAAETPALRSVFNTLLDRVDALNDTVARRLAHRLRHGDPIATRVKLTKTDAAFSLVTALRVLP
jgi:farnesyl-diphosphate farnesyltransferase